jgi:hypothetical protein
LVTALAAGKLELVGSSPVQTREGEPWRLA